MNRRKGEITGTMNERDFPHIVELCTTARRLRQPNRWVWCIPPREAVSDPMCELFEVLWPELVHKLPPKEAVCRSGQRKTPHERGRSHV